MSAPKITFDKFEGNIRQEDRISAFYVDGSYEGEIVCITATRGFTSTKSSEVIHITGYRVEASAAPKLDRTEYPTIAAARDAIRIYYTAEEVQS